MGRLERIAAKVDEPHIRYTKVLKNIDVVRDRKLKEQLLKLSHKGLQGGIKAVWNYPEENPSEVVIAFDGEVPVGVVTVSGRDLNIFVDVEYRRKGIATKLKQLLKGVGDGS